MHPLTTLPLVTPDQPLPKVVTYNSLRRQYLKQQATDEVYQLYMKTYERRGKAEENANFTFKKDY